MRTKIVIEHDSVEALTATPLWRMINDMFLIDGPVSVDEIAKIDEKEG